MESRQRRWTGRTRRRRRDRRHRHGVGRGAAYRRPAALRAVGRRAGARRPGTGPRAPFELSALQAPVPRPRQVFAIGMNYAAHAAEAGVEAPEFPPTFTKFRRASRGPTPRGVAQRVRRLGGRARRRDRFGGLRGRGRQGWSHVAGLTVGQDLSERIVQTRPPAPQFSLGKSFPGFGPTGPWVITPDELDDPDDLALGCTVNGEEVQKSRTSDLIFGVDALVHLLVDHAAAARRPDLHRHPLRGRRHRAPPRFLAPGDELVSTIEGIGTIHTHLVDRSAR